MSINTTPPIESRVVVYCCDSNGQEFTINYFPQEAALIYAFDTEQVDASTLAILFADMELSDFVMLQYLLITLGERLTTSMVREKGIMFVEKVVIETIKREEAEELA